MHLLIQKKTSPSKSLFLHYYNKSGHANSKKQGAFDADIAKIILTKYLEYYQRRVKAAQNNTHYLTDNKEHLLVKLCTVLGSMGYGLMCNHLHGFADGLVNKDVDEHQCIPISKHMTEGLFIQDLVKVVAAASLDPKRVHQETVGIRDVMFLKLNSNIQLLFYGSASLEVI